MRTVTIRQEKLPASEPPALDRHAAETRNNQIPEVRGEPDLDQQFRAASECWPPSRSA
jgi:hypothetical protein